MRILYVTVAIVGCTPSLTYAQWQVQPIVTDADFRGLCVVNSRVVWVSGTKGTIGRTVDAGEHWSVSTIDGAEKLDFRDIEAFGDSTAYALSAGPGDQSRIYKTRDGGSSWQLQFKNTNPKAFFDAIAFWDENHGIALSDPIDGFFQLVVTEDGGANWKWLSGKNMPAAQLNEGAFAASGTCLVTSGTNDVWFGTGGAATARVFHSNNRGQDWTCVDTPIVAGTESAGIFSLTFRDPMHGLIVGGDYRTYSEAGGNAAITADGGKSWTLIDKSIPFCSAAASASNRWVAVGTAGSHISMDNGATWQPLDRENYNCVAFARTGPGWAAGPKGRIAKFAP